MKKPWEPKQAWIVRPGHGGTGIISHGLRTRVDSRAEMVEIVLTNLGGNAVGHVELDDDTGRPRGSREVSLWITSEQRKALIIALGGAPHEDWVNR